MRLHDKNATSARMIGDAVCEELEVIVVPFAALGGPNCGNRTRR
jgi:hypothetical protein